ncbi:MAG TPA: InlB B-repeat-containing protein, partial [Bacilli bacterium]|nr:InlB B-repeat-containing protein [Bacilli bacterium]
MHDNLQVKKNRKFLLFSTTCLLLGVAVFVIGHNSQLLQHLTYGDSSYTITLNEANSPLNLAMEEYGSGEGYGRYVEFKYTLAKLQTGSHAVLGEDGTLFNSDTTRITSIKSITATFTGGQATLEFGPTKTTIGDPQVLTTATPYYFSTDPYFFVLTNTGTGSLVLASLVINYSCQDVHSTIEFVTNGGSSVAPITQAHGSVVEAPSDPTKTGYLLDGWYTEPALINEFSFTTMPIDDVVLHAKWIIDPAYPFLTLSE